MVKLIGAVTLEFSVAISGFLFPLFFCNFWSCVIPRRKLQHLGFSSSPQLPSLIASVAVATDLPPLPADSLSSNTDAATLGNAHL
ncbi:hypothetical protein NE237_016355 [Protea cynaroides]|uniref:Uncharacterized protein n=1 Tax=Protea cynaroides TaxID=273540 RepID=A0A9Q0GKP9_9MAGN|nr:hypothetical protein NE237_016355 [Protea cynaroides]